MANLDAEFSVKFTKQELIAIINNLLVIQDGTPQGRPKTYLPGEGVIINAIAEKIRPLVQEPVEKVEEKPEEGATVN